jgi:hypothetical protein
MSTEPAILWAVALAALAFLSVWTAFVFRMGERAGASVAEMFHRLELDELRARFHREAREMEATCKAECVEPVED